MTDDNGWPQFAQAVDYYLSEPGQQYVPDVHSAALAPAGEASDALLLGYALEGARLAGAFDAYRHATEADAIAEEDGRVLPVKAGDRIRVSSASAARAETHFPEAGRVNPRRPLDTYAHLDEGPHTSLGREVTHVALAELFRATFRRKGLRRVKGPLGQLKRAPAPGGGFMTEDWGATWPFPTSMKVAWDEQEG